jgi:hypothetical protein
MPGSILHGKRANHDLPVHGHSHYDIMRMRIETQIDRNLNPSGPLQKERRRENIEFHLWREIISSTAGLEKCEASRGKKGVRFQVSGVSQCKN